MKLSNLILLSIVSVAFFYIQLWDPLLVTPMYVALLGLSLVFGVVTRDINMTHISSFILVLTGSSYIAFSEGFINYITPSENKLLQGTIIYGVQLIVSLSIALLLIFRVQVSRMISKSKQIELTHFDGVFHWIYLYLVLVNLLALLENIAWSYFEMKSWTIIYDNFEGLVYIAYALCSGTLLTMMILSARQNRTQEPKTS
ncbi:hypothetical protein [Pseudoalteromonas ardens]|uniref:Intracellular septation protein n=1 Tax=Pseudoalteromonas rubra TaxID=43658 RepID=A0A0L0EVA1_9GAMM|nr:hypothetical protein [Pseudoalteromonas sp. R96]KNC68300.1 hypothetical protein AC626_05635 [Pseudoalteromonas rubra]MDK1310654.1 hypothetical protein [Pseudoalteromonas sp. R96]